MSVFYWNKEFNLEQGGTLQGLAIDYQTYGTLNEKGDNVIWICHALTASADVDSWWPGMIGPQKTFDPSQYFIVCANILGSCYGTTGPLCINPKTNQPYYGDFPFITIRDMVGVYQILCQHLGVRSIEILVGGSMGGYQALEWCLLEPSLIRSLFLIATAARESPWRIAIHTAQRMAIEADNSWGEPSDDAARKGLMAARAIGMLTYRNAAIYDSRQAEESNEVIDDFKASSYIHYQGTKLADRFNAYSYWILTKAMDSHNLARGRGKSLDDVVRTIEVPALVLGVESDILCPVHEQEYLARLMLNAQYAVIDSVFGHDGFLTEVPAITHYLVDWMYKTHSRS